MVHDNDFLITGPGAHMNVSDSARGTITEFTGNSVDVTETLSFGSAGALTIGNNELTSTNIRLFLTNEGGETTVTNNSVTAPSVDGALLELTTSGRVAVTDNQFMQEVPPQRGGWPWTWWPTPQRS